MPIRRARPKIASDAPALSTAVPVGVGRLRSPYVERRFRARLELDLRSEGLGPRRLGRRGAPVVALDEEEPSQTADRGPAWQLVRPCFTNYGRVRGREAGLSASKVTARTRCSRFRIGHPHLGRRL
jgi:hypothetical protein